MTAPGGAPPAATGDAPGPAPGPLERRARRLLRWYPAGWRMRYGEEFAELLLAELSEQPRAWRRTVNVAHCGITARLAAAGLAGPPAGAAGARASLGTLTCSLAVFLTFGTAMWAQLAVGWQWAPPATAATSAAMLVMSGSLLFLAVLALLAAVPAGWAAILAGLRRQAPLLRAPALLIGAGALILALGGRHFGNGWPGTGSMGGYGALLLAEKYPGLISAVAAIGPAIWTSYGQARAVNPDAYASAAAFTAADTVTHARALRTVAVRVACGVSDPFYPGVQALAKALPPGAVTVESKGCHSYPFFTAQEPPSLAFLGRHLTR